MILQNTWLYNASSLPEQVLLSDTAHIAMWLAQMGGHCKLKPSAHFEVETCLVHKDTTGQVVNRTCNK